jgi:hypothetical protein
MPGEGCPGVARLHQMGLAVGLGQGCPGEQKETKKDKEKGLFHGG